MLIRIRKEFNEGLDKIKWFSSLVSERLKVELAVVKLLRESDDLERSKRELSQKIGDRVFEIRGREDIDVLSDARVRQALKDMEEVDTKLHELKSKVSEIGKAEQ